MSSRLCEVCGSASFSGLFEKAEHSFSCCDRCGLERIDPQPSDATLAKIYGSHYYDAWGLHGNEDVVGQLKKKTFEYVLGKLPPRSGGKLLDLGAATGFLLEVARERGYEPYGVELSEFGAKEIARKFGDDRAHCGELATAPFAGVGQQSFDVVTMCDYIEHVRDPEATLRMVRKNLRAGGAIAITSPDTGSVSRRALGHSWSHYKVEHLFYFSRKNLTQMLHKAGFSAVEFYPLVKTLSLDYVHKQLEVYPHQLLTPVSRTLRAALPKPVMSAPLKFLAGELLAVARG
jgi:2-polyprenyl-3-methyl-5-hydroxy-6-metoxy-1,4-benzoquinol methylase